MSDHPSYATPNGPSVTITVPPKWYTNVSGLSRQTYNQMIRLRFTTGKTTNTKYLEASAGQVNDTMRIRHTTEGSYSVMSSSENTTLELTHFYSTNPTIKGKLLERKNAVSKGLVVRQVQTPPHLHDDFPDYVTFFVFVQDSPDEVATAYSPLYNDAICSISLIKGTGLGHDGEPVDADSAVPTQDGNITSPIDGGTAGGAASTGGGSVDGSVISPGGPVGGGDGSIVSPGDSSGGGAVPGTSPGESVGTGTVSAPTQKPLDILFLQDVTGSQATYLKSATDSIYHVCDTISSSGRFAAGDLRVGLIAYRDHPPQDLTFVTKNFGFTSSIAQMQVNLKSLTADGGGDGPEAVTAAMADALTMPWRADASKMVIIITDAPPHGIGEPSDQIPSGSPDGKDPLDLARRMAEEGITLHVIACEPTLSTYSYAVDFFRALTAITSGLVFPLTVANRLAEYIIGASLETVEMEALISDVGKEIARRVLYKSESVEDVIRDMYAKFTKDGLKVTTLSIESVYKTSDAATHNVELFKKALELAAARVSLLTVEGHRLIEKFASGTVAPAVEMKKEPISEVQIERVVKQSITRNADVEPGSRYIPRPSIGNQIGSSIKTEVPTGWVAFISGLSRAKYNQAIKLELIEDDTTDTEFMISQAKSTDEIMKLERTREGYYVFIPEDTDVISLQMTFLWSKMNIRGSMLAESGNGSQKLRVVEIGTPMNLVDHFPDFKTYFVLAEDEGDTKAVARGPGHNDAVGIINLIKATPMVKA